LVSQFHTGEVFEEQRRAMVDLQNRVTHELLCAAELLLAGECALL
jgi:hypothetical protein